MNRGIILFISFNNSIINKQMQYLRIEYANGCYSVCRHVNLRFNKKDSQRAIHSKLYMSEKLDYLQINQQISILN